ncbi:tumor suppressor protein LOH1CR12 [Trinorchestia longiramus]|nr:tumor suppressor protein LOH1CR12 [Trinorchestia longiramus]
MRGALRRSGSHRRLSRRTSSLSGGVGAAGRPSEVVVVREAPTNTQQDADLARLQLISPFLPIMRGALTAPAARDPEVLERISPAHLSGLCRAYQAHLHAAAATTAATQDDITAAVKQVEATLATVVSILTERQRAYARHAEHLSRVGELSHSLTTCHANLNTLIETLDTLNNLLPIPDRLEPFVWTTG